MIFAQDIDFTNPSTFKKIDYENIMKNIKRLESLPIYIFCLLVYFFGFFWQFSWVGAMKKVKSSVSLHNSLILLLYIVKTYQKFVKIYIVKLASIIIISTTV